MNAIASLATSLSALDFESRQGFAVAKLTLDQAKADGDAVVELIRAAAETGASPASDPSGCCGTTLDTFA